MEEIIPEVIVMSTWTVVDKWWLPKDERIIREWADVFWDGKKIVFVRNHPETIWKIYDKKVRKVI